MLNDTQRINIRRHHEMVYWTEKLELTSAELTDIIDKVGTSIDAIRTYVGR